MGGTDEKEDPFARIASALRDDVAPHHPPPLKNRSGAQRPTDGLSNLAPVITPEMVPAARPEPVAPPPRQAPSPELPSIMIAEDSRRFRLRPAEGPFIDSAPTTIRGSKKNQAGDRPQSRMFGTPAVLAFLAISIAVFGLGIAAFMIKRSRANTVINTSDFAPTNVLSAVPPPSSSGP